MSDEQKITVIPPDPNDGRVYQRTVIIQNEGSILFPLITLAFYFLFFPVGLVLNLVGLFTGPHRGCFLAMLIFLVIPGVILFLFVLSLFGFSAFMTSF